MNLFIIGDVHGCYYTFKNILDKHWNKENEIVIQLGDLIDRGVNSPQVVEFARTLKSENPEQVNFLKGNHEFEMILHIEDGPNDHWLRQCGEETLKKYELVGRSPAYDVEWFKSLPLYWENEHIYVSHAGISTQAEDPFDEDAADGVLWNRGRLKDIGKLQVIGHTPCSKPTYDDAGNTWNIDTGAAYSGYLTGIKVNADGEIAEFIREETDVRDKEG